MQRLSGASLLVFANKQDIQGALSPEEIAKVSVLYSKGALSNFRQTLLRICFFLNCSVKNMQGFLVIMDA